MTDTIGIDGDDAGLAGLRIELEHVRRTRDAWRDDVVELLAELKHLKADRDGYQRQRDRAVDDLAAAEKFASECYGIVGEVNAYRDTEVLDALRKLAERGEQRDQWIARAVKAEDELNRLREQLAHLAAEHAPTAETPNTAAVAGDEPRCVGCGRTRATHQLIRGHSFTPRTGGPGADGHR